MSNNIKKSKKDKREYKFVVLPNKLKVMLIHDKDLVTSTATMSVNVGSIGEPVNGLAHFLEHMLFLGSEKYPQEDYYNKILGQYNGNSNGFTTDLLTCYYYTCQSGKGFAEVLDIFGHFFIQPKFSVSAVLREMKAVDSEHKNNILNDRWRSEQVLLTLCEKNHPFNHFGTGNIETLNIPNIVEQVKDYYYKNYY